MARHFTKYPSNYVKASTYDTSKYKIVGFTPESYERLKKSVANGDFGSDDTFGYIERVDLPYAIDVVCRDYGPNEYSPDWDTYILNVDGQGYNDPMEGGALDLSLSYDEQVDYLISELEKTIAIYNR